MSGLRPRRLLDVAVQRVAEEPVVIFTGPRTVGKSTLLAGLSRQFDRPVFDLDQPDVRAAAAADPGFLVTAAGPVLDEVITASHFLIGGFVLNLGELAYRKEDKIAIMPLSTPWS